MNIFSILTCFLLFFTACQNSSGKAGGTAPGFIALSVQSAQSFNPNAVHGEVSQYKVTITGDSLPMPIVKYFSADATEAHFDGFPSGSTVNVVVEYINVNGVTVRRGAADQIAIQGGATTPVDLTINNVPIFANVRDGATVVAERFVPKVFAPGGITFSLSDDFNGSVSALSDVSSGEADFSVSTTDESSLLPVHVAPLTPGPHELTVNDPDTGESSTVHVTVVSSESQAALPLSSGGYTGSVMNSEEGGGFNLVTYLESQSI